MSWAGVSFGKALSAAIMLSEMLEVVKGETDEIRFRLSMCARAVAYSNLNKQRAPFVTQCRFWGQHRRSKRPALTMY